MVEKALNELHKKNYKIVSVYYRSHDNLTSKLGLLQVDWHMSFQVDKLSYKEAEVSLLVKLGQLEEGEKLYRALLSMNPDNYRYIKWILFLLTEMHNRATVVPNKNKCISITIIFVSYLYSWRVNVFCLIRFFSYQCNEDFKVLIKLRYDNLIF